MAVRLLLLALTLALPATAQAGWGPARTAASAALPARWHVADGVAPSRAWWQGDRIRYAAAGEPAVTVAWTFPVDVLDLQRNRRGDVAVAWRSGPTLLLATRAAGDRRFSYARQVAADAEDARLALDQRGRLLVAWSAYGHVLLATGEIDSDAIEAGPRSLGRGVAPRLAVGTQGDALVAWLDPAGAVHAAVRPALQDAFATLPPLAGPGRHRALAAAVGASGDALVAWQAGGAVDAAYRPASGTFAAARRIAPGAGAVTGLRLALGDAGSATAAWSTSAAGVVATHGSATGSWSRATALAPRGADLRGLAARPRGGAVALWLRDRALAAALVDTAGWRPAQALSGRLAGALQAGLDPAGTIAWWTAAGGRALRVRALA
jgi:hypothetical protein